MKEAGYRDLDHNHEDGEGMPEPELSAEDKLVEAIKRIPLHAWEWDAGSFDVRISGVRMSLYDSFLSIEGTHVDCEYTRDLSKKMKALKEAKEEQDRVDQQSDQNQKLRKVTEGILETYPEPKLQQPTATLSEPTGAVSESPEIPHEDELPPHTKKLMHSKTIGVVILVSCVIGAICGFAMIMARG